jgi:hypothetical protein
MQVNNDEDADSSPFPFHSGSSDSFDVENSLSSVTSPSPSSNSVSSKSDDDDGDEMTTLRLPSEWKALGEGVNHENLTSQQCLEATRQWTERIPIGLGLCPWAMKSLSRGNLRFAVCMSERTSPQVSKQLLEEARRLVELTELENCDCDSLHTTLVICPKVDEWNESFAAFEEFVDTFWSQTGVTMPDGSEECSELAQHITCVAFHPKFLRWRGLPEGIEVGKTVQVHKAVGGFQKSRELFPAIILETETKVFGRRRVRVKFQDDASTQYVPIEWCLFVNHDIDTPNPMQGPPLPDNLMHQSPFPTIHLIRNHDLGRLRARDVSRVKRKNAQRMTNVKL